MSNILLMLAHSIEEHDMLKLLTSMGHDPFSLGGYINPSAPHDDKRPALPEVPYHPDLHAAVDALGTPDNLEMAKRNIPQAILDWLGDDGIIICHHLEHTWLVPQWPRLRDWMQGHAGRRVIWRTVGQSVEGNERMMAPLRRDGLERVAYSPKEQNIPGYIGHDALIRFYKDPEEWQGWTGDDPLVINFTQHLRQRDPYTNWRFWELATRGLNRMPCGPGSEAIGGTGGLSTASMQEMLRRSRAYLYTGTQPASYTLGLIEAMMTGIPVVSIGPSWMQVFPYGPDLFEGHELAFARFDDPAGAHALLADLLNNHELAAEWGAWCRDKAVRLFGIDTIREQWGAFLGAPVAVAA